MSAMHGCLHVGKFAESGSSKLRRSRCLMVMESGVFPVLGAGFLIADSVAPMSMWW